MIMVDDIQLLTTSTRCLPLSQADDGMWSLFHV